MTEQEKIGRIFFNFLRRNRCLYNYFDNCCKASEYKIKITTKEEIIGFLSKNYYIGGAFLWSSSKEGHWYWSELNQKWGKELDLIR